MDIDASRSISSRAAEYLPCAKECSDDGKRATDPKVRETLLKVVASLTTAALSAASSGSTPQKQAAYAVGNQTDLQICPERGG